MMKEWSVRFSVNRPDTTFTETDVDTILDALKTHAASGSYSPHELSVRFTLASPLPARAVVEGLKLFHSALREAGIAVGEERIVDVELELAPDLDKQLLESNLPELVGVAEVAQILNVSKQRVSDLARSPDFPRPIEILAAGPIWKKSAILRHVGLWPRKPGRPRKSALSPRS